ncbi:DUF1134 domain-containing protein [uncultured Sphingomonas sp.]|uniref:DUF1134 domain-containing protein n=1 Tax=uncultured Sphingomonas sp. TaxID=158754 RepID=UPI0035CBA894
MRRWMTFVLMVATGLGAPATAQRMTTVDPNVAIDGDLKSPPAPSPTPTSAPSAYPTDAYVPAAPAADGPPVPPTTGPTYQKDDLIGAAEGVFGKGAKGLGGIIEKILREQGRPNAYIAGREASGAFVLGLRYGSGVLSHKVEGQRKIYWTGPSVGFDVGGDAAKVFVLVYNLYDTEDVYKRFPGGEGRLYFVGGFAATYLRRGNIVLIPVRLGVGWRAGVNVGYMKFSRKSRWLPF